MPRDWKAFCEEVGQHVEKHYGHETGADVCYSLFELGFIHEEDDVDAAARFVATIIEKVC